MPTVRIPPGVVRGESRAMVPGRWGGANLIRWRDGNMCPVGGWVRISPAPLLSIPRAGLVWMDANFKLRRAVLCDAHIYVVQPDGTWTNITPDDFVNAEAAAGARGYGSGNYGMALYGDDSDPRGGATRLTVGLPVAFTLDNWNTELLIGSSADGRIWTWNPNTPTDKAVLADGVPKLPQNFLVTEEHHLMVFGGDGFPNRVAWSDQGFRNQFDPTIATGQAGFIDLEGAGTIYAAKRIPNGILVFTQTSVWLGQYIGSPFFYGFTRVAEHLMPISPQAVVVAAGKAYWMTASGFAQFASGVVNPLPCTIDLAPFEDMDPDMAPRRVTAGFNGVHNEIWWFYPTVGQTVVSPENDRYVAYNFSEGWWTEGKLARSFFTASPIESFPYAGAPNKMVYQHEKGYLNEGSPRGADVYAEATSLSFDDGENVWTVTRAWADARNRYNADTGAVQFTFKGATERGKAFTPKGTWKVGASGSMDARFSAREFSVRVEGVKDVPWSAGAMKFDAIKRGTR